MRYLGGKTKIAAALAQELSSYLQPGMVYYEPFLGSAAVAERLARLHPDLDMVLSYASPDLMLLYKEMQAGRVPPCVLSEDEYRAYRNAEPSAMRGFAGYGASFGGKFFGGYARGGRGVTRLGGNQ